MNYAQHNKEMDGALYKPEEPVVFLKADSSLLKDKKPFFLPEDLGRVDYETELVVRICRLGKSIPQRFAHRYYDAVTCGIDFTACDLQAKCKEKGLPWTARFRPFISILTSMARPFKRAVRAICSMGWMN